MEPRTPVEKVQKSKVYPTPGTSQQAKTPEDKTHGSPTSTGTFQSVEISPKLRAKEKAAQTPQSTLSSVTLQGRQKYVKVLGEYFQKYEGKDAVQACSKLLQKKNIHIDIQSVDRADIWEQVNTEWHSIAGYPPDNWKNVASATLIQWWAFMEILMQSCVGYELNFGYKALYNSIQENISKKLEISKVTK